MNTGSDEKKYTEQRSRRDTRQMRSSRASCLEQHLLTCHSKGVESPPKCGTVTYFLG